MKQEQLNVHSIESFGTVDGPGIRFVVFTRDCPLRCSYCHNPDTWCMKKDNYIKNTEIIKQVLNVRAFMGGGAITVSGGEPLLQIPALIDLFTKLKRDGIHTCIDTSGYADVTQELDELIKVTDLFLIDIKHINDNEHLKLTGRSNKKIFKFINHLNDLGQDIWIRHVLIPGITTQEIYLRGIRDYIDGLSNVKKVEVLPYHEAGRFKYEELGLPYLLEGIEPPTEEQIKVAKSILGC